MLEQVNQKLFTRLTSYELVNNESQIELNNLDKPKTTRKILIGLAISLLLLVVIFLSGLLIYVNFYEQNDALEDYVEYPYIARINSIRENKQIVDCGGILINPTLVITAAHCLHSSISSIVIGGSKSQSYADSVKITKFTQIRHPQYNLETFSNDIGLIKFNSPVKISNTIEPACLPHDDHIPENLALIGFKNKLSSGIPKLYQLNLPLVDKKSCTKQYEAVYKMFYKGIKFHGIDENQICAGGDDNDAEKGDSGMPLLKEGVTASAVYALVANGNEDGLAPGVYTKIFPYIKWIHSFGETRDCRKLMHAKKLLHVKN